MNRQERYRGREQCEVQDRLVARVQPPRRDVRIEVAREQQNAMSLAQFNTNMTFLTNNLMRSMSGH